jgi:hypothetical protein
MIFSFVVALPFALRGKPLKTFELTLINLLPVRRGGCR